MKKSMVLVLITLMIISVFMISCNSDISDNSSGGDKLVKVVFSTENTGSKGISATPIEAAGPNTLYWYYKASKADSSLYRTGETVALGSDGNNGAGGWNAVNPDGNGNAQAGFATSNDATYQSLKYFSEGSWVFSFRAYSSKVDWDTTNKDQAYITDNSQITYLDPVYYQDNLSASITSTTIATDGKYHITISPTAGDLGNAVLVFPTTTGNPLNWKYDDDNNGVSTATLAALSGKSAVMKVFYTTDTAITGDTQWIKLAISTNNNAISDGEVAFADFAPWDGTIGEGDITLESSVAGIDYKLRFEVWSTDLADKNVMLGSFNLQSATAYLGGKIELAIASGSNYAVTDNESQIEAVITDVNPVAVVVQATTASATDTSATATIVAPAAPEIASADADNKTTKTSSPAMKIESSVSAVSTGGANTGVSIPEGGLADTTTTATYVDNGLTTTVTTSSTHNITIDVKNEEAVTGAEFAVTHNNVVTLAGIDFTLTKTTTQTTTSYDSNGVVTSSLASQTETEEPVTDFNDKYTTVYATIKPNQTGVQVLYSGNNGDQPVFNSSNTNPSIAAAEADTSVSDVGTGYNPTTGLIVFKTNHFSQFYVTSTPVAEVTHGSTTTKYGSLEEAVYAAVDGDKIKLLNNITYGKDKEVDVWGKAFNLDLNGMTFTTNSNQSISLSNNGYKASAVCYSIENTTNKNVAISGGTIRTDYGAGIYADGVNLILTIEDVYVKQNYPENVQTTDEYSSAVRLTSGANVVINSGTFEGKHAVAVSNSGGTVTINGGTFNSDLFFSTGGTKGNKVINITGGTFNNFAVENGEKGTLTITGGIFSSNPSAYVAEGYVAVVDSEHAGYYKVQSSETPVATLYSSDGQQVKNYYASSYKTESETYGNTKEQEAFNAAIVDLNDGNQEFTKLVLGTDIDLTNLSTNRPGIGGSEQLWVKRIGDVELDLNGHYIKGMLMSGDFLMSLGIGNVNATNLVMKNTTGTGHINSTYRNESGAMMQPHAIWALQHYVTLESGTYSSNNFAICSQLQTTGDVIGVHVKDGVTVNGNGEKSGCVLVEMGKVVVDGGQFEATGENSAVFAIESGSSNCPSTIVINGGSFNAGYYMFAFAADHSSTRNIEINGGSFTCLDSEKFVIGIKENYNDSFVIKGGTFSVNPYPYVNHETHDVWKDGSTQKYIVVAKGTDHTGYSTQVSN